MVETIRRNLALREYDIKELPSGQQARPNDCRLSVGQATFSLKFVKKNGELVFVPWGVASGLPFSVSGNRMRGVMPVDDSLRQCGHVIAVDIDAIVEWNGKKVVL